MKRALYVLNAFVLVGVLALPVLAQGQRGKRGEGKRPTAAQITAKVRKLRSKVLRNKVGLSDAKAKKVEKVFDEHAPARRKIMKRLRAARQQLRKLFKANSNDQKAYEVALDNGHKAHTDMLKLRNTQYAELKKILQPKELAKLLHALKKMQMKIRRKMRMKRGGLRKRRP